MRLSGFTDCALRLMIFAAKNPMRRVTIEEVATDQGLSRNHLMKVAAHLARSGLLDASRGRAGGVRLARSAASIRLGDVVRSTEGETLELPPGGRAGEPMDLFRNALGDAMASFLDSLDGASLADLIASVGIGDD